MGDEFDGCECIWSHEMAMQRLLNFIRQNQDACSDTNCIDVSGRMQQSNAPTDGDDCGSSFTMMTMIMIFAMIMYLIRPDSILKLTNSSKRNGNGQDPRGNGGPSAPPPSPPAVN